MKKLILNLTAVATLAAASLVANAQSPLFVYDNVANFPAGTAQLNFKTFAGFQVNVALNGVAYNNTYAGWINTEVDGILRSLMCVQLDQTTAPQNQPKPYNVYQPTGQIGWLVNQIASADTNAKRVGLQVAIWEVSYDFASGNPLDLTDGIFTAAAHNPNTTAAINYATQYLAGMGNYGIGYTYYGNSQFQDFVGPAPVPEPMTMALAGLGLSAVGVIRRKRS